jgi:hypothetical protein
MIWQIADSQTMACCLCLDFADDCVVSSCPAGFLYEETSLPVSAAYLEMALGGWIMLNSLMIS